jgi:phytoene dehydrogenase-like protein
MADYDAIVIGSGHNGLVCAALLARAGWRVIVLERASEIGGAVRTAEVTLPGFRHDLFASNVTLFAASPAYQELTAEFANAGLRFLTNKRPYASAYADGKAARVYTEPERTEREMAGFSAADLAGWHRVLALYKRTAANFLPLHFTALPSAAMARLVARLWTHGPRDACSLSRIVLQSSRGFVDEFFHSPEVKGLFTPWGFHMDYGPDVRGGATFALIAAMSAYVRGLFVAEGGAGEITAALRKIIERQGGAILTGMDVTRVDVEGGRAAGIATARGDTISAGRAVIANVTTRNLFGGLVRAEALPARFLRRIRRFRYAPGTFVVHLALGRKLSWRAAEDLAEFNYVHVAGGADDIAQSYAAALAGDIPARPMLVVSQTTQIDPSRAPEGKHVARIHARAFPAAIRGDAAGRISGRDWDGVKEQVADRLIDLLAEHAPNLKDALLARNVVSPLDLERGNANLIGGDCNGGSHHLDQHYFCRPLFGWSRYRTPIRKLYMIGASTWPGGGVNGASGYLLARQLLA